MKRLVVFGVIAVAVTVAVIVIFAPVRAKRLEWVEKPQGGEEVSLVRLIATPERFDGKKVMVFGYVVVEFEGTGIYLHEEDSRLGIMTNGLWLAFGKDGIRSVGRNLEACPGYAYVEGVFHAHTKKEFSPWSGGIRDITRVDFVRPQKTPNQTPEPTPPSVTPRADARVAPASVVAHL